MIQFQVWSRCTLDENKSLGPKRLTCTTSDRYQNLVDARILFRTFEKVSFSARGSAVRTCARFHFLFGEIFCSKASQKNNLSFEAFLSFNLICLFNAPPPPDTGILHYTRNGCHWGHQSGNKYKTFENKVINSFMDVSIRKQKI